MFNTYMPYQYQQPTSLTRVTGIDGARAYQMQPNSTAALFDSANDIMYIKSTDGAGFPTIRTFKFSEVQNSVQENKDDYISRKEFENFKQEVLNNGKQFIRKQQSTRNADEYCDGYD